MRSSLAPFSCTPDFPCLQAYGEIRSLYTAAKQQGFVVLSFYDLRAASLAMHSLQGAVVKGSPLTIRFSSHKDNMGDKDAHQGKAPTTVLYVPALTAYIHA